MNIARFKKTNLWLLGFLLGTLLFVYVYPSTFSIAYAQERLLYTSVAPDSSYGAGAGVLTGQILNPQLKNNTITEFQWDLNCNANTTVTYGIFKLDPFVTEIQEVLTLKQRDLPSGLQTFNFTFGNGFGLPAELPSEPEFALGFGLNYSANCTSLTIEFNTNTPNPGFQSDFNVSSTYIGTAVEPFFPVFSGETDHSVYGFPTLFNRTIGVFDFLTFLPIQNASVNVTFANQTQSFFNGTTNSDGFVSFTLESGDYTFRASKTGFQTQFKNRTITFSGGTNFFLNPSTQNNLLSGFILEEDGTPIQNAEVSLFHQNGSLVQISLPAIPPDPPTPLNPTQTSSSGFYNFANRPVPNGIFTLQAKATNHASNSTILTLNNGTVLQQNLTLFISNGSLSIGIDKTSGFATEIYTVTFTTTNINAPIGNPQLKVFDSNGDQVALFGTGLQSNTTFKITMSNLPVGALTIQGSVTKEGLTFLSNIINLQITTTNVTSGIIDEQGGENILDTFGVNTTSLNESGFGFVILLFTPFMLLLIAGLVVATYIERAVKSNGLAFAVTILGWSFAWTLLGIFPIIFGVVFIILSGMLVAFMVNRFVRGG